MNLNGEIGRTAELWLLVIASGLYHGVNPGMGWPLALNAGLMERSERALALALCPLMAGHLLAMLFVLLPFSLLLTLVDWRQDIQVGASILLIGFGLFLLIKRRHPRVVGRIGPAQLGVWSFAVAMAHGAGLMLIPIYLGLCTSGGSGRTHWPPAAILTMSLPMAALVSIVHAAAMIGAGGLLAWLVYRYLGLKFVSRSWVNLDAAWAASLILIGLLAFVIALANHW